MSEKLVELASSRIASLIKIDLFGADRAKQKQKHKHQKKLAHSMTEIQVTAPEQQQQLRADSEVGAGTKHSAKNDENSTSSSFLKPKTSLLMRARNSTINLASLATVTTRFGCSASVGNLWHHGQQHGVSSGGGAGGGSACNTSGLLSEPAEGGIQTLEYTKASAFDSYLPGELRERTTTAGCEPESIKSASCHKLQSGTPSGGGSSRKLSTKEKCKRQKEAERVEKLRLLVNYLKSGSSQPVVSPVALEADEIELAERYKLHMILRDDLLANSEQANTSGNAEKLNQQQQQRSVSPISPPPGSAMAAASTATPMAGLPSSSVLDHNRQQRHKASEGDVGGKVRAIGHSIGGTTASSPVSSSSGSMNHAHSTTNDGRSIPHIGNVTWVLRHSISDPGNNFERSPAFSSASTTSSQHNNHHHHQHHLLLHNTGRHPARDHHTHNLPYHHHLHDHHLKHQSQAQQHDHQFCATGGGDTMSNTCASSPFTASLPDGHDRNQSECLINCESCAPSSSSYSGVSLINYCSAPAINAPSPPQPTTSSAAAIGGCGGSSISNTCACDNTSRTPTKGPLLSPQQPQPPKLFYIDDMDPIPSVVPLPNGNPMLAPTTSTPTIAASTSSALLPPPPPPGSLSSSSGVVYSNSSTCCSQPVTPAISTTSSSSTGANLGGAASANDSSRNYSSLGSTSAWSNAPNLATWIDNEVNSLVHDLEATSQGLSSSKSGDGKQASKGGKKKWLSVTSRDTRRNSSGAQST